MLCLVPAIENLGHSAGIHLLFLILNSGASVLFGAVIQVILSVTSAVQLANTLGAPPQFLLHMDQLDFVISVWPSPEIPYPHTV